jgi:superfamily II DNA/RNA helicase
LNVKDEIVKTDWFEPDGRLRDIQTSATGFYKEKAYTAPLRVERTAEIIKQHPGEQFVIWCDTNDEADRLKVAIPDCVEVRGLDKPEKKEKAAIDFVDGKIKILVSKSEIFGFGLNFQNCHNTIFCGMNYSFEGYYQAVRRFHRFGQTKQVNVWRVMGDTEHNILAAIERKESLKANMQKSMSEAMKEAQISNLRGLREFKISDTKKTYDMPEWLRSVV